MNRIQFGEGGCEKTRKYLDSYISNELLVETNHELLRHLDTCQSCAAELEDRTKLRARLKSAVNSESAPPELQVRIREQIRRKQSTNRYEALRWAAPVAAAAMLCIGVWLRYSSEKMPALADRPAQNVYIQKVSASLAAVLRVGLGDHIHCSIFRKYPKNPPSVEKMEADLGPAYQGLLPIVRAAVPDGYRVLLAHQCSYAGRKFVHLTFEKDGDLLSLVVARKNLGESLSGLSASVEVSGVSIYQSGTDRYKIAAFDAGNFLAYVVSDLRDKANLQIAENIAPAVREFLMKAPA